MSTYFNGENLIEWTDQQLQAQALLAGTVQVVSKSNPVPAGHYAIDAASRQHMTTVVSTNNAGLGLPSGANTFNWPDADGNMHEWPADKFTAFAQFVMKFWYQADQVAQGIGTTLPSRTFLIL